MMGCNFSLISILLGGRFLMRVQCVISCGLTRMIDAGGEYLLGVLDIHLGKILPLSLTTLMGSLSFLEPTSLLWRGIIGARLVNRFKIIFFIFFFFSAFGLSESLF